jgi:predicted TIM-barrel fold metal-dependent hydrolase
MAAGMAAAGWRRGAFAAAASETKVAFDIPRGACDCHVHIVADPARFPMAPDRVYTPPPASVAELLALQQALHFDRVVVVQPSFYGTDNAVTVNAVAALGAARGRGVAVIGERTSAAELEAMAKAGIRGVRVNLETVGEADPAVAARRLKDAAARVGPLGWHVQVFTRLPVIAALAGDLAAFPAPLVFDHFGGARAALGTDQPGFHRLLSLVASGKAYVKISGAYRISKEGPDYGDAAPLARALIGANPERIVWGTDWPHTSGGRREGHPPTEVSPDLPIDDARLLNQLPDWAPDAAIRRKILVDNPARLYGF